MKVEKILSAPTTVNNVLNSDLILNTLGTPILALKNKDIIEYANGAAENFFQVNKNSLLGSNLSIIFPPDSPIYSLLDQATKIQGSVSEFDFTLENPRIGTHSISLHIFPIPEIPEVITLLIQQRSIAAKIERQFIHRDAVKAMSAMSAIMAHEVKNPLSGIRGAAQLLEKDADKNEIKLTSLIQQETDRICDLLDRMAIFRTNTELKREPINIHLILDRVQRLAKYGFASHTNITSDFDPSLPPICGNYDELIQVFLNLVKNAAEAVPAKGGNIFLQTSYQNSVRFTPSKSENDGQRKLLINIFDNGPGISTHIGENLFDPFITSKRHGKGLGLAVVAKIINDHGGIIEYENLNKGAVFRVMLPMYSIYEKSKK